MISNNMRISGLATGLDTDTMVRDLMKAQRQPLDKLLRKKQTDIWKRDQYREMNLLLSKFRDNVVGNMRLQRTFLATKIKSTDDNAVSVVSRGAPQLSNYSIKLTEEYKPGTYHATSFTSQVTDPTKKFGEENSSFEEFTISLNGHVNGVGIHGSIL